MQKLLHNPNVWWIVGICVVAYFLYQNGTLNTSPPANPVP